MRTLHVSRWCRDQNSRSEASFDSATTSSKDMPSGVS